MEELFVGLFVFWLTATSIGALDNMLFQTPDNRIISQCKNQGYITVKQTVISCSIEKEVK